MPEQTPTGPQVPLDYSSLSERRLAERVEELLAQAAVLQAELRTRLRALIEAPRSAETTSADVAGLAELEHLGALYEQNLADALRATRAQARLARQVLR